MRRSLTTALTAALFGATAASVALAQPAPGPRPGPQRFQERPFSRPTERIEARLAYIKTALKITAAQEPQWNAYADVMRKGAKEAEQRMQDWRAQHKPGARGPAQRLNAIERLERMQTFHANAVTRINELLAVEKPLYAALSPEQKRVADQVLTPGRRGGMMMHGMMMQHRGGFPGR